MNRILPLALLASLALGCAATSKPQPVQTPSSPEYYGVMCFLDPKTDAFGHSLAEGKFVYDEKTNQITFTSLTITHQHDQCLVLH